MYNKKLCILIIVCSCIFGAGNTHAQSWLGVGSPGFTAGVADNATIAIDSSGTPYVAYVDENTSLYQATVMKYNGTGWVPVGRPGFTPGQVQYTSIAIDRSGVPYVAYMDVNTVNFRASVMKFADTGWVAVGDTGFSQEQASFTCIALDTAGTPYVAYLDDFGCLGLPTVMKYNGTSWVNVGTPRFSTGNVPFISMAISGSTPYVAYPDGSDTQKATVKRFIDTGWVVVGNPGFSAQGVNMITIAMSKDTPYVAFTDYANSRKTTVMKYDGSNWVTVGIAGFSAGEADNITIAVDNNGAPYVFYEDETTANLGATVMKYNGSSWVAVGAPGFTTGLDALNTTMAIDKNGTPYTCFQQFPGARATVMKFGVATDVKNSAAPVYNSLEVYPNPNNGQFTINVSMPATEKATVTITNILGEKVKEFTTAANPGIQVALDVPGLYFVTAAIGSEKLTAKIVVE